MATTPSTRTPDAVAAEDEEPKIVWAVHAEPGDNRHVAHNVCVYSKYKDAKALVDRYPSSRDYDDDTTWTYTVKPIQADSNRKKLDEGPPGHFPYTGW